MRALVTFYRDSCPTASRTFIVRAIGSSSHRIGERYVPVTSYLVTNYVRDRGHTQRKSKESVANEIPYIMGTNQPSRLHNFTSNSSLGIPTSHSLRFCSNLFCTMYHPRLFGGDSKARSCTYGDAGGASALRMQLQCMGGHRLLLLRAVVPRQSLGVVCAGCTFALPRPRHSICAKMVISALLRAPRPDFFFVNSFSRTECRPSSS